MKKLVCTFISHNFSKPFGLKRAIFMARQETGSSDDIVAKIQAKETSVVNEFDLSKDEKELAKIDPKAVADEGKKEIDEMAKKPFPALLAAPEEKAQYEEKINKAASSAKNIIDEKRKLYEHKQERIRTAIDMSKQAADLYSSAASTIDKSHSTIDKIFAVEHPTTAHIKEFKGDAQGVAQSIASNEKTVKDLQAMADTLNSSLYMDLLTARIGAATITGDLNRIQEKTGGLQSRLKSTNKYISALDMEAKANSTHDAELFDEAKKIKNQATKAASEAKPNDTQDSGPKAVATTN